MSTPAEIQAAAAAVSAALMPLVVREKKAPSAKIAAKIQRHTAGVAAHAAKAALAQPVVAGAGRSKGAALPAAPVAAKAPAERKARPDRSTTRGVKLVGDVIRVQLSPTPETVRAVKAGKVPPAATLALAAATKAAPGMAIEIAAGKKIVASTTPSSPAQPAPAVAAPVTLDATPKGG